MKTYLKLVMLAIVLITPTSIQAAEPTGAIIERSQGAQQEPQRIPDPVEFFDKTTGKVKVWYWRAESGYEFYDAPGFHPRQSEPGTRAGRRVFAGQPGAFPRGERRGLCVSDRGGARPRQGQPDDRGAAGAAIGAMAPL